MFTKKIKIQNRTISEHHRPLVIVEVSANHKNSLKNTFAIIEKAAEIGAEAIKFQTFDTNEMTLDSKNKFFMLKKQFKNNKWNERSLYDLYKEAHFPYDWHKKVFEKAKDLGLICLSSVFDLKSVDFLEKLNVPAYKIASLESMHFPLIERVCQTGKPIIISTGTLDEKEIVSLINFLKQKKCKKFILLHCVTEYPANPENLNLKFIEYLNKKFNCLVGFSDHTQGIGSAICSVGFGSSVIEKHFKLNNRSEVLDKEFSLDPAQMQTLIKESEIAWKSIGNKHKKLSKNEKVYKKFRRSIFACNNIKKDEIFSEQNIKIVRPAGGLEPKFYKKILGKKSKKAYKFAEPILISGLKI
jgi:pseudaminic acid synthase